MRNTTRLLILLMLAGLLIPSYAWAPEGDPVLVDADGGISVDAPDGTHFVNASNTNDKSSPLDGHTWYNRTKEAWVGYDGTNKLAKSMYEEFRFSIQDPENIKTHAGRATKSQVVWRNDSGMTFTITSIWASSDADDYTFLLFKSASSTDIGTANDVQIDSVACSTDGTGHYYASITSGFDSSTVEDGKCVIFEHSSGTAESIFVHVKGRYGGTP